ncbi:MAG: AarF/ABC1/UbiB kinase family protein [Nitriliruptorales bacterium]|nr:AarF/ABC1/UbiB kinase family protein [Nitriliruptorales bacterium]
MADGDLGGRVGRAGRLARTGARSLAGLAAAKARELSTGDVSIETHEQIAARLADVLGEMKGGAMKLGQILSFVDFDLPPDVQDTYHDVLASLRDAAPAMDVDAIRRVVTDAYGMPPEQAFAEWSDEPLAAASIGQVHRARLHDGTPVAVKVQYPGVASAVRADLDNAETFAPIARLVSPNLDIGSLMDELRDRVEDELDYAREASYQNAFATRWRDHPYIHVPAVHRDMCREFVLVSDLVEGQTFDEVAATGSDERRQWLGEIIFRYAFGSLARFRFFNGDPHPGNYLVLSDKVAFIDYGAVKMFTRDQYRQMREIDEATVQGDRARFERALRSVGIIPRGVDTKVDILWELYRKLARPILAEQPFTYTREFAAEVISMGTDLRSPLMSVIRDLNFPPEYLVLNRIQVGLNSVLGRLSATNDWVGIRAELLGDADAVTELGRRDAAWLASRNGPTSG